MFSGKFKFEKKQKISIGLDIGSNSVKTIVLEFKDKEALLKNFDITEISGDAENLGSGIKKSLVSAGVNEEKINISLSGQSVVIRYAWLPLMPEKDLKSSLRFEAAKLIPFSPEEVNADSHILKQDASNNKMLVLIVAAKKEAVSERIKLLQNLGFKLGIIDVDSLALVNAFNFNYPTGEEKNLPKVFALLNIGASVSNLNILEEGIPVFSRDIYIAGNNFSKKISDSLGINFREAETAKRNQEPAMLERITSAVEPVLASLISEIRISFDYYESQGASSVEKIFLSGGGSLFYNLKDSLNHLLGVDIDYWDTLQRVNFPTGADSQKIKSFAAQFAVALGLAMH